MIRMKKITNDNAPVIKEIFVYFRRLHYNKMDEYLGGRNNDETRSNVDDVKRID
jgi:hypothetical protein